ncbi:MAG: hypothetical protein JSV37_10250 [Anaerolineaceae bacterium]|nr:MAG: hypothetical protein JSV37_10250 [Anaerolineaceae bacterium]
MHRWICGLLIIGFLTACTITQPDPAPTSLPPTETSGPPTTTSLPPTEVSGPPTPTLVAEPILFGEVTFDGRECTVEGPEEVPRGVYYFILNDESDKNLQLWVNQIFEGKTFEDLLAWQDEPGVYVPPPTWIEHPRSTYSFEVERTVHFFDQAGNYAILVGGYNPSSLWFCEPFRVVEVEAE